MAVQQGALRDGLNLRPCATLLELLALLTVDLAQPLIEVVDFSCKSPDTL